jgi:hypothetical protein
MSGIHDEILNTLRDQIEEDLIAQIADDDPARAGVVKLGDLQGDPDPDTARIAITLHENDPDTFRSGSFTGMIGHWSDEVEEVEIGGAITWKRRFSVKARCLLVNTKEDLATARDIASTVRTRLEASILRTDFGGILVDNEYVSLPVISENILGEMIQGGGPPDSYDYQIKMRFQVLTTKREVV